MNKYLFTATFFVAFSLCSKTFELREPEFDFSTYQNCLVEKSPVSSVISEYGIENFNYDSFGNLIQDKDKTFSYNDYGQISEITYNDGKKVNLSYDAFGRLTQNGNSSFEYNDFNMMSRLTNPYFQAEYSYDQKTGYRSSKTVNGVQYDFTIDDNGNLIEQTDSIGNTSLISWNNSLPETLTYNGTRYNFVCNNHGDVIALTDENGEVVNSYEYDIYGKILSESEAVPNPIRYAHEYYDTESGLYYLRGRYYNPETKSFTTADPAEADSKLYAYTGYNPIEFIDPSGYMPEDFPAAIAFLLHLEGGAGSLPGDKGGKTKFGISANSYPSFLKLYASKFSLPKDNMEITVDHAINIYKAEFWAAMKGDKICDREICMRLLALYVNAGSRNAGKITQKALLDSGKSLSDIGGSIDGILGAKSISAINSVDTKNFLQNLYKRSKEYYTEIKSSYSDSLIGRVDPAKGKQGNVERYISVKTLSEAKKINNM